MGRGRPGWHIECSALALRELGPTIDLHGGGVDLLFPHHESCRAQSEAVTGQPFVRHWLHQAMVHCDGRKMSKSTGNLVFVGDLRERHDAAAIGSRCCCTVIGGRGIGTMISSPTPRHDSLGGVGPVPAMLRSMPPRAALDDDLDTPTALAAIDAAAEAGAGVSSAAELLGVEL